MPQDEFKGSNSKSNASESQVDDNQPQNRAANQIGSPSWSIFTVPPPIRRLFNRFPLVTYPANELPTRSPSDRGQNVLYVFTTAEDAAEGRPSFNPGCLKWQTYLKLLGISFRTVASNNHASPSGALPFLLPALDSSASDVQDPVPSSKLQRWAKAHADAAVAGAFEEPSDMRYEAYLSLLDLPIRRAWLYTLYLNPTNFTRVAQPLYITPTSSNSLVQLSISRELRHAALLELQKHSRVIAIDSLYSQADAAFSSLETLLGQDTWFFGAERPGLFDASVFAYTHLLLDDGMAWAQGDKLAEAVKRRPGLVKHRARMVKKCF